MESNIRFLNKIIYDKDFRKQSNLLTNCFEFNNFDEIVKIKDFVYVEKEIEIFAFDDDTLIHITFPANDLLNSEIKTNFLIGHTDVINCLCIVDKDHILSGSNDTTIKLWNILTLKCVREFNGHFDFVNCLELFSTGKMFFSGSDDTTIKLWDIESGECLKTFSSHQDRIKNVQESEFGQLFSLSKDGVLRIWDILESRNLLLGTVNGLVNVCSKSEPLSKDENTNVNVDDKFVEYGYKYIKKENKDDKNQKKSDSFCNII
ncbi:unnamed protein product [Brachionus calyciflorus]|uniref:Uncharacterized protein n=1 Tax=Brachionus calyciflorus TaxID=104777 RepID=A0A813WZH9_9BILA|nr:unnamed protein product [Brachionus calyciflorus]